ncbi:MAG: hypothetical protein WC667_00965 [Sulfurimonas sp.]
MSGLWNFKNGNLMKLLNTEIKDEFILVHNNQNYNVDYFAKPDRYYNNCNYLCEKSIEYDEIKTLSGKELIENLSMSIYNFEAINDNLNWFDIANNHELLIFKFHFSIEWYTWNEKINLKEYVDLLSIKLDNISNIISSGKYIDEGKQYISFAIVFELNNIINDCYNEISSTLSKLHQEIIETYNKGETTNIIKRCIEFEPEYYQAGLGILNYFGTVVREKYPDGNAKVKIEQNGYSVTMTIETKDGEKETIEKLLQNYELVIIGEQEPETFFDTPLQIINLNHELGIAKLRIETQKELLAYQNKELMDIKNLFKHALTQNNSPIINMEVSPIITVEMKQTTKVSLINNISEISSELKKIINDCDDNMIKTYLTDVNNEVHKITKEEDKNKVKESSALSKIRALVEDANKTGSALNTFLDSVSNGVDTMQKIGKKYNAIAEWCGAPQVPSILL